MLQLEPAGGDGRRRRQVCRLLEGMVPCEAISRPPRRRRAWPCPTPSAAIPALLRRLDGNGLRITGLQMTQPSLDDVFLKYTGRHIREEAADQPIILGW